LAKNLTEKQEKFVLGLIEGKSQREAYRAAYPSCKAPDAAVDAKACKLFKIDKVRTRYNELRDRLIQEAENDTIITAKEVLAEIVSIAKDDISNYLDFRTEKTQVGIDRETGEPIIGYAPIVELKDSRTIKTKNVSEVSIGANGQFKFKTYCRDTALYKLADILGLAEREQDKDNSRLEALRETFKVVSDNFDK